jgi:hypothetical protein
MPASTGPAAVITAITRGCERFSVCIYTLTSPLESQNSQRGALLLTEWVCAGKMPGMARLPKTKASLLRDGHAKEVLIENLKQNVWRASWRPHTETVTDV